MVFKCYFADQGCVLHMYFTVAEMHKLSLGSSTSLDRDQSGRLLVIVQAGLA